MTDSNRIIIYLPGIEPQIYDLDLFAKPSDSTGTQEVPTLFLGRGTIHGSDRSSPANNIIIDKKYTFVSRAQCSFKNIGGSWYIYDDNSRNGMIFRRKKIRSCELHDGDRIYIGENEENGMVIAFSARSKKEQISIERYKLKEKGTITIGRGKDCDIVLTHPTVSRRHCLITGEGGSWYVEDLHSMHGVVLNGKLLAKKEKLRQMDKISIADTTLFFDNGYLYLNEVPGGVGVVVRNLYKKVGKKRAAHMITDNVSLSVKPGEFAAIIGGSGAGKTTLLDCMSGMTKYTGGSVFINGEDLKSAGKNIRSLIGYVPQQDIVHDNLTLERMLFYSARLRMPEDTSEEEIRTKTAETLETVGLSEHRNTMISKLSGGQRKRASIAVELLASPKLFFLDEPSSGLDPGTERQLMHLLKSLSDTGKTVIMVTHTVQNIDLCDRVVCMGKGGLLCYSGPPEEAKRYFGKKNFTNIYDDLNNDSERMADQWLNRTLHYDEEETIVSHETIPKQKRRLRRMIRQFGVITTRYAEIMKNSTSRLVMLTVMPVLLTLLVCLAFQADAGLSTKLGLTAATFMKRKSFPFLVAQDTYSLVTAFSCAAFWTGIFNSIQEISKERSIYEREKFTGLASAPYVMSKFVILSILSLVQSLLMTSILFFMSRNLDGLSQDNLASEALSFGMGSDGLVFSGNLFYIEIFLTVFLCVMSAMCLGLMISAIVSNDMAPVLCPICLLPQILFSGVVAKLTGLTEKISYIISCRWSTVGMLTSFNVNDMYYGYEYGQYKDPVTQGMKTIWHATEDGSKCVEQAYAANKTYLFNLNPVVSAWTALGLLCLFFLIASIISLHFRKRQTR